MAIEFAIIMILLASSPSSSWANRELVPGCYESIVSFGDSLTDTGNYPHLFPADDQPRTARPPYGRTFFHHPTGRCSDGRLIIDFIAESLGLPLVPPYLGGENDGRDFSKGVNFAVVGATALDNEFYEKMGIYNEFNTNASLGIQMGWFKQFLATIPDGRKFLEKSLVLMGEIGGNDYNYAMMQGASLELIESYVPLVINYIGSKIEEVIKLGAQTLLVPGNLPLGCLPVYLTQYKTVTTIKDYDSRTGCLYGLNKLSRYHNELLVKELNRIRELYPDVTITYGDYYTATMRYFVTPYKFGFTKRVNLRACCGAGGPYNYNSSAPCAVPPSTSCHDPSLYVSWDGMHLTEAAYGQIAQGLIGGSYITPHITTICPFKPRPPQVYEY